MNKLLFFCFITYITSAMAGGVFGKPIKDSQAFNLRNPLDERRQVLFNEHESIQNISSRGTREITFHENGAVDIFYLYFCEPLSKGYDFTQHSDGKQLRAEYEKKVGEYEKSLYERELTPTCSPYAFKFNRSLLGNPVIELEAVNDNADNCLKERGCMAELKKLKTIDRMFHYEIKFELYPYTRGQQ